MTIYKCDGCLYESDRKSSILNHINKIFSCSNTKTYSIIKNKNNNKSSNKCNKCFKEFYNSSNRVRHEKFCVEKVEKVYKQNNEIVNKIEPIDIDIKYHKNNGQFIYILQTGNFIGTDNYKIGRTKNIYQRIQNYKHYTTVIVYNIWTVKDSLLIEDIIIKYFANKFKLIKGREWFNGSIHDMINVINKIISI